MVTIKVSKKKEKLLKLSKYAVASVMKQWVRVPELMVFQNVVSKALTERLGSVSFCQHFSLT